MKIFISYRRDDSAGYAGRLFDFLTPSFGAKNVFMDIDTIEPGEDFRKVIANAVGTCDVVLVLIGKHWLSLVDAQGRRRLDDPSDWVRVEIATALANPRVRVIPVLVHNARMPGAHELPEELKELSWRNSIELSDSRFQHDTKKLIQAIEGRRLPWRAAILIVVLGIFYFTFMYFPNSWQLPFPVETVGPTDTSVVGTSATSKPVAVVTTRVTETPISLPANNTTPIPAPETSISSATPVQPTIAPTTTNTISPVATTLAEITDCPVLYPDSPYPTPFAQQTPRSYNDNYYLFYKSNFETLIPRTELRTKDWAEYYLYWTGTPLFKSRVESNNYTVSDFIVPDNRQPPEGNYSICIKAPPPTVAPAEFQFVSQPLPADELLRLSFFYKTYGIPDFKVHLTAGGTYTGPFYTVDGPSDEIPQPLMLSDSWTQNVIDFRVNEAEGRCNFEPPWGNRPAGCFNLRFMVEGTGIVWIDDVSVGKAP